MALRLIAALRAHMWRWRRLRSAACPKGPTRRLFWFNTTSTLVTRTEEQAVLIAYWQTRQEICYEFYDSRHRQGGALASSSRTAFTGQHGLQSLTAHFQAPEYSNYSCTLLEARVVVFSVVVRASVPPSSEYAVWASWDSGRPAMSLHQWGTRGAAQRVLRA